MTEPPAVGLNVACIFVRVTDQAGCIRGILANLQDNWLIGSDSIKTSPYQNRLSALWVPVLDQIGVLTQCFASRPIFKYFGYISLISTNIWGRIGLSRTAKHCPDSSALDTNAVRALKYCWRRISATAAGEQEGRRKFNVTGQNDAGCSSNAA
jgi:hypothetical protein